MWPLRNILHAFQLRHASIDTDLPALTEAGNAASETQPKNTEAVEQAPLYSRESDFLTQDTFREVLSFERKRSERSRKPIALLLLNLDAVAAVESRNEIMRSLGRASIGPVEARPIKGWYEQNSILGIIISGTGDSGVEALRSSMVSGLAEPIRTQVDRSLRSYCFASGSDKSQIGSCSIFYPDSERAEKSRSLSLFLKRLMDIAGGLTGLLLFSPLFLLLGLLIKLTSKGPVLFRQERIGLHGEKFVFLKFRTMFVNNDSSIHQEYIKKLILEQKSYESGNGNNGSVYKIKDDPRVTPVGRFLRKTSLDELPQFFNVLMGEMSIVGPRPPIPYELESYDLWHRRRVMEIKPGITGLWQVNGRSSTTFDEMVRLDLKYAKEWSIWLDIKIILKTPWVVLTGKGGY